MTLLLSGQSKFLGLCILAAHHVWVPHCPQAQALGFSKQTMLLALQPVHLAVTLSWNFSLLYSVLTFPCQLLFKKELHEHFFLEASELLACPEVNPHQGHAEHAQIITLMGRAPTCSGSCIPHHCLWLHYTPGVQGQNSSLPGFPVSLSSPTLQLAIESDSF